MSAATRYELDVATLSAAITTVSRHRKISLRDVAAETGLSPSTLTRLAQGQKPDADALLTLLVWLNADADRFTRDRVVEAVTDLVCREVTA
jgi:transcriptional regulator with XRE-family HTH domain